CPDDSMADPASLVRVAPMASNGSSAKPMGSNNRWHPAHVGALRWVSSRSRSESGFWPGLLSLRFVSTSGGGGGGGVPTMFSRIHLPRMTGEVRVGLEVTVSTLALLSSPPPGPPPGRPP